MRKGSPRIAETSLKTKSATIQGVEYHKENITNTRNQADAENYKSSNTAGFMQKYSKFSFDVINEFRNVNEKIDKLDSEVRKVNIRLDIGLQSMEHKMNTMNNRIDNLQDTMNNRIDGFQDTMDSRMNKMEEIITSSQERIERNLERIVWEIFKENQERNSIFFHRSDLSQIKIIQDDNASIPKTL